MKVLLATDGSNNAIESARFLKRMQLSEPMDLTLLSVSFDPAGASAEVIQPWFPEWLEQQQADFEKHHSQLESMLSSQCSSVSKRLKDGHAASVILEVAKESEIDLIVMGAQGHSAIGRFVLGSVSDSVATHADCSVLVVHPGTDGAANSSDCPTLALAYDSSSAAKEAVAELTELGLPAETPLTLISVAPVFDYSLGEGLAAIAVENEQAVSESMTRALEEACQAIRDSFPKVSGRIGKGRHIGDTIIECVDKESCELLVIGDAGHSLIHDWILGSTTKFVLRNAPCSVWLSRHHRKPNAA